ncbi:MAG TPA: hypothetical protein VGM05_11475 [Planctomycetaceae bacterium]|jgi:hypothetical protein
MIVSTHKCGFRIETVGRRYKTFVVMHEHYGAVGYYLTLNRARQHIASCHRATRLSVRLSNQYRWRS